MVHIVFIHLDLGIGGAEQLILQLAQASLAIAAADDESDESESDNDVVQLDIVTTRCDANHCFASVKPGTGNLYPHLHVYGQWIPASVLGDKGRALCSTIRLLYLTYCVARGKHCKSSNSDTNDTDDNETLIVLDVLPTPLPFLRWLTSAALLFYCHFPDQLLTRSNTPSSARRAWYRSFFNNLENTTMQYADTIVVNSKFTQRTVRETFPFLRESGGPHDDLPVLYPALDTSSLDQKNDNDDTDPSLAALLKQRPIVSLNRYERKKNLELLLQAIQWIQQQQQQQQQTLSTAVQLPPIIIAGGYDTKNVENVEYRAELEAYCKQHNLLDKVTFLQSISDATRRQLLHDALVVVYTPTNEHFGIVPLEAMYSGSPVICVNSGGPVETVLDGKTGFLCEPTALAFGTAIRTLLQDPTRATTMGQMGRTHVIQTFGQERLHREWKQLVYDTIQKSRQNGGSRKHRLVRCILYVVEALVTWTACLCLVYVLRRLNLIPEPSETIWKALRQVVMHHRGGAAAAGGNIDTEL